MKNDFIITVAWPEGMVTAPGSWYDKIVSTNGKYRVGHSAIILINSETKKVHYFDFGRYHTPKGYGRVRDIETDADVAVIAAEIQNGEVVNIEAILLHISVMKATHGEGKMFASLVMDVNFDNAFSAAKRIQQQGMLPYGPFIRKGTNCSRFVASVMQSAGLSFIKRLRFKYPFCISPSPKRNVCISNHHYYVVENNNCIEVKKSKLHAYFSSIEQ
jgi:hypothetical protein